MVAPAAVQEKTLENFITAWKSWSAENMLAVFSDDFEQSSLPYTMGVPTRSRAEVEMVLPKLTATVKNFELNILDVVHDPGKGKAAIYATSKGDTPFGDWTNEYAAFVTFDAAGAKVRKVEEMLDSAFMEDFAPKFQKHLEQGAAH